MTRRELFYKLKAIVRAQRELSHQLSALKDACEAETFEDIEEEVNDSLIMDRMADRVKE